MRGYLTSWGGSGTVGVSIVAVDGEFSKPGYRKYRIASAENDDFASIYELFCRKFANVKEGGTEKPADLYVVDGGIGQLNSAIKAAKDIDYDAEFISISKGRSIKYMKDKQEESIESVHIPGGVKTRSTLNETTPPYCCLSRKSETSLIGLLLSTAGNWHLKISKNRRFCP